MLLVIKKTCLNNNMSKIAEFDSFCFYFLYLCLLLYVQRWHYLRIKLNTLLDFTALKNLMCYNECNESQKNLIRFDDNAMTEKKHVVAVIIYSEKLMFHYLKKYDRIENVNYK